MTGRFRVIVRSMVILAALCAGCAGVSASEITPEPPPEPKVQFDVLARATADGARLGLRYRIAPGWHIYWENPGESGMATSATAQVPAGMQAGPLRFPAPERFGSEVLGYGYSGEVVLFVDVTGAPRGQARVASRWLVCNDICEPESGEAAVSLDALAARSTEMEAFEAQLPRPLTDTDGVQVVATGEALTITVTDATAVTLFPSLTLEAAMGGERPSFLREEIVNSPAVHALRASLGSPLTGDETLGVLRIERATGPSFVDLRLPRPAPESP